jgi:hypothetical protein
MTLTPAYGKDYKTKKEALEAFENNVDFVLNTYHGQSYCNKEDLVSKGFFNFQIRYNRNTKVFVVKL